MQALFTEHQLLIQETADKIAVGGLERARAVARGVAVPDDRTEDLVADWSGLGASEAAGGHGGSLVDLALLLYALGRKADPSPFGAHVAAVQAGLAAGLTLDQLARPGERLALQTSANDQAAAPGVVGCARIIRLGADGDLTIHPVKSVEAFDGLDTGRGWGRAVVGEAALRVPDASGAVGRALALVAADLCGTAQGAIELAVDYANQRHQFGRPIGAYQAISHRLAQAKGDLEAAWSLTLYACWAADHEPEALEGAAAAAKAMAGDVAVFAAEACIQTYGGMGITMEADPHLYLKRALASDAWIETAYGCRQKLARLAIAS